MKTQWYQWIEPLFSVFFYRFRILLLTIRWQMGDRFFLTQHIYVIVLHSKKGREPLIILDKLKILFFYAQTRKLCCIRRISNKKG
jgi:hypothetical protein